MRDDGFFFLSCIQLFKTAYAVIQRRGRTTASGSSGRRFFFTSTSFSSNEPLCPHRTLDVNPSMISCRRRKNWISPRSHATNNKHGIRCYTRCSIFCTVPVQKSSLISPQKAKLDMLTLDRHHFEQAPIIFINTPQIRIEPHTIRFTSYPSSVWNSVSLTSQ